MFPLSSELTEILVNFGKYFEKTKFWEISRNHIKLTHIKIVFKFQERWEIWIWYKRLESCFGKWSADFRKCEGSFRDVKSGNTGSSTFCNTNHFFRGTFQVPYTSVTSIKYLNQWAQADVRKMFQQVERLLKLILVNPASSCTAERSFSSLRRLKTWLRSTMKQSRLNHLLLCDVHSEILDKIEPRVIAEKFIDNKPDTRRKSIWMLLLMICLWSKNTLDLTTCYTVVHFHRTVRRMSFLRWIYEHAGAAFRYHSSHFITFIRNCWK